MTDMSLCLNACGSVVFIVFSVWGKIHGVFVPYTIHPLKKYRTLSWHCLRCSSELFTAPLVLMLVLVLSLTIG
jgi:hypothetical protein